MELSLVVHGAGGRMGRALVEWISQAEGMRIAATIESKPGVEVHGTRTVDLAGWDGRGDVVIDFSAPAALASLAARCHELSRPLVSGTTGLGAEEQRALDRLAERAPVVVAANFSPGLAAASRALAALAAMLGEDYDCEIVETHHGRKVDAPSGTALMLGRRVASARGRQLEDVAVHGRSGAVGARPRGEIGLHAVRMGDVVGVHEVHLAAPGESITLCHRVTSREVFVRGAVLAARAIAGAPAGRISFEDALLRLAGRPEAPNA